MPTFEEFEALARAKGATAKDCGGGHWQARHGEQLVNYYPFSRRGPVIYVAGTSRSVILGGIDAAIGLLFRPPPRVRLEKRLKPAQARKERERMLAIDPHCHWCRCVLTSGTATLDHRVPLGRGGTNRRDNLLLACRECNHDRGMEMPELRNGAG